MSQLTRLAAAMAVLVSVPAFAATAPVAVGTIYGGGATLPLSAFVGSKWLGLTDATSNRQSVTSTSKSVLDPLFPAAADSLFAQVTLTSPVGKFYKVSYCGTGSGAGRNVLRGTVDATATCGMYDVAPAGFGAETAEAHFAASDAPFSSSEYNSFGTGPRVATRVAPVQLPAVAAALGVIFNNSDLGNAKLNLTESQLCQVVSGAINNWNQLGYASKPIVFVKRSDSSGTTFSFTNHLSATCPSTTPVAVTGFVTQNTLTTNVVGTAITGSGNGGVVAAVLATDGAIGYADVADGQARAALNGGGVLRIATLSIKPDVAAYVEDVPQNNADGSPKLKNGIRVTKAVKHKAVIYTKFDALNAKHFPASVAVSTLADQVVGSNDVNGRPTMVALTPLAGATAGCMQTVAPDTYAKPALNAKGDYVMYPIIGISYLMGYNAGNSIDGGVDKADAVRRLLSAPYAISSKVKTIGKKKGFGGLTITAGAGSAATTGAGLVSACVLN